MNSSALCGLCGLYLQDEGQREGGVQVQLVGCQAGFAALLPVYKHHHIADF